MAWPVIIIENPVSTISDHPLIGTYRLKFAQFEQDPWNFVLKVPLLFICRPALDSSPSFRNICIKRRTHILNVGKQLFSVLQVWLDNLSNDGFDLTLVYRDSFEPRFLELAAPSSCKADPVDRQALQPAFRHIRRGWRDGVFARRSRTYNSKRIYRYGISGWCKTKESFESRARPWPPIVW